MSRILSNAMLIGWIVALPICTVRLTSDSEIPEEWPPLSDVLNYQDRIRSRVRSLYDVEGHVKNRKIGRALWLAFEHEGKLNWHMKHLRWWANLVSNAPGNVLVHAPAK